MTPGDAMTTESGSYHAVAKTLHWVMALVMLAQFPLGYLTAELPKGVLKSSIMDCHKQVGVLLLILAVARLAWRLAKGAPPPLEAIPALMRRLAGLVHWLLYGLMLATPVLGILNTQAGGWPVRFLGWPLPILVAKDHDLHELAEDAHAFLAWFMALLIAGHVAAALYHQFVQKDGTLARMLPAPARLP